MNTFKHIFFALFVLFFTITGCKKDSDKPDNMPANNGIEVKNGYLVFKDTTTFIQHMEWIKRNRFTPEIIENFNLNIGFISSRQIYNHGTSITNLADFEKYRSKYADCFEKVVLDDNSIFWEMPMEFISSLFVNENGIFQIGDFTYRTTPEYFFSTKNKEKVSILPNTTAALLDEDIQKKINLEKNNKTGQYSYKTAYFPGWSDRRIVVRLKEFINPIGNYCYETRTTSQQRHWSGAWVQAEIHKIDHFNQVGHYQCKRNGLWLPIVYISSKYLSQNDCSEFNYTVVESNDKVDFTVSSILCDNSGTRYGVVAKVTNNDLFPN